MVKKKILLISFVFSPNIGGVESHLDDLCGYLTKEGHRLTVITYQPLLLNRNTTSFEKKKNFEIRRIAWLKFNLFNRLEKFPFFEIFYLVPPILIYSFFYLLKNKKKIDIIQTHGFNMAIVGFILSSIFRINFTVNTHVNFCFEKGTFYSKVLSIVLNKALKILVLTNSARRELEKIGVKKNKIVVYHQWIDNKLFLEKNKTASRKKVGIDLRKFVVLFIGRFVRPKGIDLLLKASMKVNDMVQFVFVGSGELKDEIKKKAEKNNNIRFVGEIKKEDLPYYYSACDISIIPSIQSTKTYSEGIPRVMIEALTCGKPVIATPAGGIKELINEKIGIVISPNVDSVVQAINEISKKKSLVQKMEKDCIKYAKDQFDMVNNAKIIEKSLYV